MKLNKILLFFEVNDVTSWGHVIVLTLRAKNEDILKKLEEDTKSLVEGAYNQQRENHLTLAYIMNQDESVLNEAIEKLKELFVPHMEIVCRKPELCRFRDMTQFIPL